MNNTDFREKLEAKNWDSFSVKTTTFRYRQHDFTHEEIKNSLTELIWDQIENFFTIAREDAGATRLNINEINNFILNHMDKITEIVSGVMEDVENDNKDDFQELYAAEPSYIKEILLDDNVDFIKASDEYKPIIDSLEQEGGDQIGNGYGFYKAVGNEDIGGRAEIVRYDTNNPPIFESELLTGGTYYNKIVNPMTGRKVNVNSNLGKKILKNYLKAIKNE
tara:strand:+ start:39 stop:701 length:663 start_codon:yes stop_codon:yes gene_type:complete